MPINKPKNTVTKRKFSKKKTLKRLPEFSIRDAIKYLDGAYGTDADVTVWGANEYTLMFIRKMMNKKKGGMIYYSAKSDAEATKLAKSVVGLPNSLQRTEYLNKQTFFLDGFTAICPSMSEL